MHPRPINTTVPGCQWSGPDRSPATSLWAHGVSCECPFPPRFTLQPVLVRNRTTFLIGEKWPLRPLMGFLCVFCHEGPSGEFVRGWSTKFLTVENVDLIACLRDRIVKHYGFYDRHGETAHLKEPTRLGHLGMISSSLGCPFPFIFGPSAQGGTPKCSRKEAHKVVQARGEPDQ